MPYYDVCVGGGVMHMFYNFSFLSFFSVFTFGNCLYVQHFGLLSSEKCSENIVLLDVIFFKNTKTAIFIEFFLYKLASIWILLYICISMTHTLLP